MVNVIPWQLLLVPLIPLIVLGFLVLSAWIEDRMLSPQALVVKAVRSRGASPEVAERLVAAECARLPGIDRRS